MPLSSTDTHQNGACADCGLHHQCVCSHLPKFELPAHIALLMHDSLHIWQRKQPCPKLLAMINDPAYCAYLLFPNDESIALSDAYHHAEQAPSSTIPLFIVLDGTWQEAKKTTTAI